MPRLNRFVVALEVNNIPYKVAFHHDHYSTLDAPLLEGKHRTLPIQHATKCFIESAGKEIATGISYCSMSDQYNWRKGIKLALTRALGSVGVSPSGDRELYGQFMQQYYTEVRKKEISNEAA